MRGGGLSAIDVQLLLTVEIIIMRVRVTYQGFLTLNSERLVGVGGLSHLTNVAIDV